MHIPAIRILLLGGLRVSIGGEAILAFEGAPRLQALLAYLLLHRGVPLQRAALAALFWPSSSESQARTNLRGLVLELRKVLPDTSRYVRIDTRSLEWLTDGPFSLDVSEFETTLSARGASAAGYEEVTALQRAIDLYEGDLLPSVYDDWVLAERDRLRALFEEALQKLALLFEDRGRFAEATRAIRRLHLHDPTREDACRTLMRLSIAQGDRAGVLRAYQTTAAALERELGVEPSPATQEEYKRILAQEAAPEPPRKAGARFTGRRREWEALTTVLRTSDAGRSHMVMITGEPGVGKSRLAEELMRWARGHSTATAIARGYQGSPPWSTVTEWLRSLPIPKLDGIWLTEVARLVPDVLSKQTGVRPPAPITEAWQEQRYTEALARVLFANQPLLLVLDDLQWCDQESATFLGFLLRRDPKARLCVVATSREDDLPANHPVAFLLSGLSRANHLSRIPLEPLGMEESAALASDLLGTEVDPAVIAQLYRETEGNPLFLVESIRSGTGHISATVQAAIGDRLGTLSPAARELADMAAVIGRSFTYEGLASVSGWDEEELVHGLDLLWRRRIIREQGLDSYDFSHGKIREAVYSELSQVRRRYLHRLAAEWLIAQSPHEPDMIAAHLEQAGDLARAASYWVQAGDLARDLFAMSSACTYYERALGGLDDIEGQSVLRKLVDVWQALGRLDKAEESCRRAIALGWQPAAQWQLTLGVILRRRGGYQEALSVLQRARDLSAADGDRSGEIEAVGAMGFVYLYLGQKGEARRAALKLQALAQQDGDLRKHVLSLGLLGTASRQSGDFPTALAYHRQQLALAEQLGNFRLTTSALTDQAITEMEVGDFERAISCLRRVLDISRTVGDRESEMHAMTTMGSVFLKFGWYSEALALLGQACAGLLQWQNLRMIAIALTELGTACRGLGDVTMARSLLEASDRLGQRLGALSLRARAQGRLAQLLSGEGERVAAAPLASLSNVANWVDLTPPELPSILAAVDALTTDRIGNVGGVLPRTGF